MARFQCSACGRDDHAAWSGELICPGCGATEGVRAVLAAAEMTAQEIELLDQAIEDAELNAIADERAGSPEIAVSLDD